MEPTRQSLELVQAEQTSRRKEEILTAALRVFSEHGFSAATTKRIAAAAGLRSAALIYWYFSTKEDLLRAVFERFGRPLIPARAAAASIDHPPHVVLPQVARALLRFWSDPQVQQVFRLGMAEYPLLARLGITMHPQSTPDNLYTFLERYFARQIEKGALRPHDPGMSAQSFLAQIWLQVQAQYFYPGIIPISSDEEFVEKTVPLFLEGVAPTQGSAAS